MPGLPLVVVPLSQGADGAEIGRLLCGGGKEKSPISFPKCATLHNALVAGTSAALDRVRSSQSSSQADLAAAFAAVGDEKIGMRLLLIPSAETRRILEETIPNLPKELGGGPITQLTRGVLWVAAGLDSGTKPSLKVVAASSSPDAARSVRQLGDNLVALVGKSEDMKAIMPEFPQLVSQLKTDTVGDRITLTADAQVAAKLIEAALRPAREAANRSACVNNEKQIGLAIHNYISAHKLFFPPAYTTDKAGKPLLSWRVLILPYLDQAALFKEFHLDEPWDSEYNRALIAKMPATYRCPLENAEATRQGKTRYLAPRGPNTIFRGSEPISLRDVTDGTSNTIMVMETSDDRAVIWTKPDDWEVPADLAQVPAGILKAHVGHRVRGSNCGFADGAVRFLHESIKPATLRFLLTAGGGEVISSDDF